MAKLMATFGDGADAEPLTDAETDLDTAGDDQGAVAAGDVTADNAATDTMDGDQNAQTFDVDKFLAGLDAIFDAHQAATKAGPYLEQAMVDAENAGDAAGLLTVLNETMGFYRSQGRHKENQWIVQRALELAARMGIEGTDAWTTTLINAATAMRAAKQYDQAEDLYRQALDSSERTLEPTDRRLAALHNNLSMVYSETGRQRRAEDELRTALRILEQSSPDPESDLDVASTHTNLALVLLDEAGETAAAQGGGTAACGHDAPASVQPAATDDDKPGATQTDADRASLIDQADRHAAKALEIYRNGHLEHSAHYASALAGYAQVRFRAGDYARAVALYRQSLAVIAECYGTDTDYYRITEQNLREAERRAREAGIDVGETNGGGVRLPGAAASGMTASSSTTTSDITTSDITTSDITTSGITASDTATSSSETASRPAATPQPATPQPTTTQPATTSGATPAAATQPSDVPHTPSHVSRNVSREDAAASPRTPMTGLKLARAYWEAFGKPMIAERYPKYRGRIAAGLVGHGSECYGFDDATSQDHDFGPRFCLWLTDEDYAAIGAQLQADYEALPREFMGYVRGDADRTTPRAQGSQASAGNAGGRRDGVFAIGDFFESITGYRSAPAADSPHEWLMLDEATLAAATNGAVFADPLGAFLAARQGFKQMPDDVRLSLISRRLGMMAQAGQYNVPRMLDRGDGAAAWLSIDEFVNAAASLVFLFNDPLTAGYLPYYKWRFAALRRLSGRMATRLADVCGQLETLLRLSSAACFGGAGFGEGGKGAAPAVRQVEATIETICGEVVAELTRDGLTRSDETFLEWQRPYVEEHIVGDAACLRSL
nr:DUF4037 domain-containing protein [Bifidobacterium leontopitheci]